MESNNQSNQVAHNTKKPNFLKWAIAIALVIVVNLFFYYIIATLYAEPTYDKFCPTRTENYSDKISCEQNGGQWNGYVPAPKEVARPTLQAEPVGYCDVNFTCQKNWNDAHSIYNRNVFVILIILSLAVLVLGVFLPIEVLSLGFSWAGVVSLIVASGRYWSDANNWLRVIILVVALGLLVWLAVKKFRD